MSELVLGIRLTADGKNLVGAVEQSGAAITKMGDATKQAASEAEKLNAQHNRLSERLNVITQEQLNANYQAWRAAEAFNAQSQAAAGASTEIQNILNRYDPLGTKLRQLQSDFSALDKAIAAGATGGTSDLALDKAMKAMNDEIAKTKGLMQAAGVAGTEGFAAMSGGAMASAFSTAQARRELIVLGHEAMTGNFSRMPGSFMVLAERIGLSGGALTGVLLPFAAVAGAAVVVIKAFHDGVEEMKAMNSALDLTSGYAGMTRGTMRELAQETTRTGMITIGTSKQIVTQLVESGQVGAQSIGAVAKLSADYAAATGRDVAKIAPDLIKLFADPAKGAEELNKQMHSIAPAQIEYIAHLERIGQLDQAQLELAKIVTSHVANQIEQLGSLGRLLDSAKKQWSAMWDAAAGIGREQTVDEQFAAAKKNLADLNSRPRPRSAAVAAAQRNLDEKTALVYSAGEAAAANQAAAEANQLQSQALALVNQVSQYHQISVLRDKIVLAGKMDATTAEQQAAKVDAIRKLNLDIQNIQHSMTAEGRALAQGQIADATKLYEVSNKSSADEANAQLKLGLITKEQHNDWLTWLDLADIARKKSDAEQVLALGGLAKLEKQRLTDQIALYDVMAKARQDKGELANRVELDVAKKAQAELDHKAFEATTAGQMKINDGLVYEIAKIRERNVEIGKTKEQVDLLKAAEMDRSIARAQGAVADAQYEADQSAAGEAEAQRLRATLDLLKQRQALLQQGSVLEAQAAATRAYQENWKQANNEVSRYLSDAIMRGFDKGETFAKNFMKSLENGFKTLVLTPVIRFILSPVTGAITTAMSGMGLSGAASAATSAGGGLASSAGSIGGIASSLTGGANSLFQNAGVAMGSQWIADIGNYGFGLPFISGLAMAATGNIAGGIGSTLGGIAGSYFGPVGTAIGSALGGMVGSMFAGSERQAQLIGTGITGKMSSSGFTGYVASNWGTSPDDRWGGTTLDPVTAQVGAAVSNTVKKMFADMEAAARSAGYAVSGLDQVVVDFTTSSQNGNQTQADLAAALNSTSDAIALKIMPNLAMFQMQGETLGQTFSRVIFAINSEDAALRAMNRGVSDFTLEVQSADPAFEQYLAKVRNFDAGVGELFSTIDKLDLQSAISAEQNLMQLIKDRYSLENDYLRGQKTAIEAAMNGVSELRQSILLNRATPANQTSMLGADFRARMAATSGLSGTDLATAANLAVTAASGYVSSINSTYGSGAKAQQLLEGVLGSIGSLSGPLAAADSTVVLSIKDNQATTVAELKKVVAQLMKQTEELTKQTEQLSGVRVSTAATAVNTSASAKSDASAAADAATELARAREQARASLYTLTDNTPGLA